MATFANQASNISALGSKLHRLLNVPDHNEDDHLRSIEEKQCNVENFFEEQKDRVKKIEREFTATTAFIVPSSKESKTIAELAELCRLSQDSTREKLEILRSRLEDAGYVAIPRSRTRVPSEKMGLAITSPLLSRRYCTSGISSGASIKSTSTALEIGASRFDKVGIVSQNPCPLVTDIGGPLESVLEADCETDGMTSDGYGSDTRTTSTASERKHKSHKQRRSSTLNLRPLSTSPTIDNLSISASTNSFLQHLEAGGGNMHDKSPPLSPSSRALPNCCVSLSGERSRVSSSPYHRHKQQELQHHLFEFCDEDNVINFDRRSPMNNNNTPIKSTLMPKDCEVINDQSKPSGELQATSSLLRQEKLQQQQMWLAKEAVENDVNNAILQSHRPSTKNFCEEDDYMLTDCDEDYDLDEESVDSTNVESTLVTKNNKSKERAGLGSREPQLPDNWQEQQEQHLFEFREEDDMITLETQSPMKKNGMHSRSVSKGATNGSNLSTEGRSAFLSRMEAMLERVEETFLDESPSQRRYEIIDKPSKPWNDKQTASAVFRQEELQQQQIWRTKESENISIEHLKMQSHHHSDKKLREENHSMLINDNEDCSLDEDSDDSTNVVATQVAEKSFSKDRGVCLRSVTKRNEYNSRPLDVFQQRPTQILVDTGTASPAHTNITMDATMMNETRDFSFAGAEEKQYVKAEFDEKENYNNYDVDDDVDNSSTVTPVLDRYRLDPSDDNSIGVKVVPNPRSAHRRNQKRIQTPRHGSLPTVAQLSPSLESILRTRTPKQEIGDSAFKSPRIKTSEGQKNSIITTTPINNIKKKYRKTPHPKREKTIREENDKRNTTNENEHPNISTGSPKTLKYRGSSFSISVPPLRPRSFEPNYVDE